MLMDAECASDQPECLRVNVALAKQVALLFDFVFHFDEAKMINPAIQNDVSYYRRVLSRMKNANKDEKCRHAKVSHCEGWAIPVASRLENGYDLHDMIGNVWEWTASPWRDRKAIPADGRDAAGVSAPLVLRGASFFVYDDWLALASRFHFTPGDRVSNSGFRLVARIAP